MPGQGNRVWQVALIGRIFPPLKRKLATLAATPRSGTEDISSIDPKHALSPFYQIRAGLVLSRPPLITRDLNSFEQAFFLYQRRLNERLALPFTRYFYFKKGTPNDLDWKEKTRVRLTAAHDIGAYHAYGKEGWNDELLVGARESESGHQIQALVNNAQARSGEDMATPSTSNNAEHPMPRTTSQDCDSDQSSLNRLLQRSLYLVIQDEQGSWTFPTDQLRGTESLRQAAERILVQAGGDHLNAWVVGNAPVGHHQCRLPQQLQDPKCGRNELGTKVFFMKARIMAGQIGPNHAKSGLISYKWLAKEEIRTLVAPSYWSAIRNILPHR